MSMLGNTVHGNLARARCVSAYEVVSDAAAVVWAVWRGEP